VTRDGAAEKPLPFREWLGVACGYLEWAPKDFWSTSLSDFFAAIEGKSKVLRGSVGRPDPISREEAEEMWAAEERRVQRMKLRNGN
jgi:hypothetical protein